jgi:hypothetical protein
VRADLDALLTAIYALVDDFLPERRGPGAPPRISDAELIALAIARVLLGLPNDRQFPRAGALSARTPVSLPAPAAGLQ